MHTHTHTHAHTHAHTHTHTRTHTHRVEAIYPVDNPMVLQDKRVQSLIKYAVKVEKAIFEAATSRGEYYQLLAEKIYRIRKELQERRRVKEIMRQEGRRLWQGEGWD